jgi:hypothetical protein
MASLVGQAVPDACIVRHSLTYWSKENASPPSGVSRADQM